MRELPLSHAAFVHLRVRSCYSLLDSTVRLSELLGRVARERMPAGARAHPGQHFGAFGFGGTEGPVGRALASGNRGRAEGLLERLHEGFPGRLYVELMRHGLEVEEQIEPALIDLAIARDLPLVATNDMHFIDAAEWEAHDVLLCIADGAQVGQADRRRG